MEKLKDVVKDQGRNFIWLADKLGVTTQTVRNWRINGRIPRVYKQAICGLLDIEDLEIKD